MLRRVRKTNTILLAKFGDQKVGGLLERVTKQTVKQSTKYSFGHVDLKHCFRFEQGKMIHFEVKAYWVKCKVTWPGKKISRRICNIIPA